jgi:hypothetical protein
MNTAEVRRASVELAESRGASSQQVAALVRELVTTLSKDPRAVAEVCDWARNYEADHGASADPGLREHVAAIMCAAAQACAHAGMFDEAHVWLQRLIAIYGQSRDEPTTVLASLCSAFALQAELYLAVGSVNEGAEILGSAIQVGRTDVAHARILSSLLIRRASLFRRFGQEEWALEDLAEVATLLPHLGRTESGCSPPTNRPRGEIRNVEFGFLHRGMWAISAASAMRAELEALEEQPSGRFRRALIKLKRWRRRIGETRKNLASANRITREMAQHAAAERSELQDWAQACHRQAEEVLRSRRPFVLFLRNFDMEAAAQPHSGARAANIISCGALSDDLLQPLVALDLPLVTIGNADDPMLRTRTDVPRLFVSADRWHGVVHDLILEASCIIAAATSWTPGLAYELMTIASLQRQANTIIVADGLRLPALAKIRSAFPYVLEPGDFVPGRLRQLPPFTQL